MRSLSQTMNDIKRLNFCCKQERNSKQNSGVRRNRAIHLSCTTERRRIFARMMRGIFLSVVFMGCSSLHAQAPPNPNPPAQNPSSPQANLPLQNPTSPQGPLPLSEEPHHRLLLQNDFIHVYTVAVPPFDATLLHTHDLPYLYVVFGPADLINAVTGQPEAHLTFQDGDVRFSPGHFSHLVRTDSGMAFNNLTVELVHPQGTAKNICKQVAPGPPGECPETAQAGIREPAATALNKKNRNSSKNKKARPEDSESADDDVPYFETDELRVDLFKVSQGRDYVDARPQTQALLLALTDANLDASLGGEHVTFLHGRDVLWMPAGQHRRIVDFLGTHSSFLIISFKDSAPRNVAQ
jgi:hypothetical protein